MQGTMESDLARAVARLVAVWKDADADGWAHADDERIVAAIQAVVRAWEASRPPGAFGTPTPSPHRDRSTGGSGA